jgi:response regulator RpfG family c-di-GMP phosphodiesterase
MPASLAALPPDWLLGAALLIFLLQLLLLLRLRQDARWRNAHVANLQRRLAELECQFGDLKQRQEDLEAAPSPALDPQRHAEAHRLARQGVDSREIADQLGLSRAEAELIVALHRATP